MKIAPDLTHAKDGQTLTAEASELGLKVGEWPETFEVGSAVYKFQGYNRRKTGTGRLGDVLYAIYRSDDGLTFNVWND